MKLKVETQEFKEMVSKVSKCSTNNKLIVLTSLISIMVREGKLVLTSTDSSNYLMVSCKVDCEDFEVSVPAQLFSNLVSKITTKEIELLLEDNVLTVIGNGRYKVQLPVNEEGNPIKFPKRLLRDRENKQFTEEGYITNDEIKSVLAINKPALAVSVELPSITCYHCGEDSVVSSDGYRICENAVGLFNEKRLIPSRLMDILGTLTGGDIKVEYTDKNLVFTTEAEAVYAPIEGGIETFPIDIVNQNLTEVFPSNCIVPKRKLVNLLDRLSLFVARYDTNGVYLTFTDEGIKFTSKLSDGEELVPYKEKSDIKLFTCCVNIKFLEDQVSTIEGDDVKISFGSNSVLMLSVEGVNHIIALMEDDR